MPLPTRRVRFRAVTPRSTASSGTRASRFDDAQLTALSNLCEPSSSAAANAVDSDAVLAPLKAAAAVVDNLKSQGRSRLASMPVRPQFNVTDETERRRSRVLSVVELAREKTPPPPPPSLKQ